MKAVSSASLLLLLLSFSVFGHGVERGSIKAGLSNSDLGLLSESTKQGISDAVEGRCDLSGVVSASAEFADITDSQKVNPAMGPNGLRLHIRVQLANKAAPEVIVVQVIDRGLSITGEELPVEYLIESSLCR